ncbi:HTH domain-containing protein [Natrialba taiwanensis]|uniref:Transcriptional regulator n=1 Tax=Natrialba taiwanensis DSM 12281 TaxID=1230458 RepID=L9ZJK8_9EURY|nr:HTH domain-containing protein [Natrialba taiwanensis]ELY86231.1 transcriptional regulator [Natrialba taiwanensis DSM 12281]
MGQFDLTSRQRMALTTLVNKYQTDEVLVSAQVLAKEINRNAGTLRNQMQTLKALGLAEGVPGPNGGYKPTQKAYEEIDRQHLNNAETVTLAHNYKRISATVSEIHFTNIHHPDLCRAQIHFQQSIQDLTGGDAIVVGPSPVSNLVIAGEIVCVDNTIDMAIIDISKIKSPMGEEH